MQSQDLAEARHHPRHDALLIAGLAADDLTSTERTRAEALRDACDECRALHADLLAIAGATRLLPAPRAPRDFRITTEQAGRLRRTGWLATLLAPFAGARSAARPLATAFTTLGLAGAFVAVVLPGLLGGAASMALAPEAAPTAAAGGAAGGPAIDSTASEAPVPQFGPAAASTAPGGQGAKDNAAASGAPVFGPSGGDGRSLGAGEGEELGAPSTPMNLLLVGSLGLLAAGLLLFALRFAARRLR